MQDTPLLVDVVEAGRRLSCGRTTICELIAAGQLESVKVGRLRRIPVEALDDYVARLRVKQV